MTRPFEGIRIIDIIHVLAGPFAAYQLAVLGAEVIKVEHPDEPDQSREGGADRALNRRNMGTSFLTQGSNKKSITLDLKTEAGRNILKKLVARADVLVENYRPGAFEALGLGYEALLKINPRLIYCSISAFGQDGVRREQTAYDHVIQATSGIIASTGTEEVNPIKIGAPAVDYATGTMGALALASAPAPAHRPRDARRRDDDASLADDRLFPQRQRAETARQQAALRHQQRLRRQGGHGDDRRQQHPPAGAVLARGRTSRHDQDRQRGAGR
jgi:crotonobetainyl-CoA:carnitine CoA-transferase CaiB-like acyl-CoA transferase